MCSELLTGNVDAVRPAPYHLPPWRGGAALSETPGAAGPWRPVIGERVVVMKTGQTATVLRLAPTEWGLLCDLEIDPPAGAVGEEPERTVHASIELRPLTDARP